MNQLKHNDINEAIRAGIDCLARNQKEDGSFPNFICVSKSFNNPKENQSTFPSCLILSSLNELPHSKESQRVRSKVARFITSQKSDFWSWNYWKRNSFDSKNVPYPDDLDDTCCAAAALMGYKPGIISVKAVAKIVNLLAYCESKEGGPYYSWITPPDADKSWKDIDLAVNSNIVFFLSLQEVVLPSLVALIEKAITSGKYNSPYYHSPLATIYFISRWYKGKRKDEIISYLLKKRLEDYSWGNPLETALAVSALINLGCKKEGVEESLASILKNRTNGEWKAYPFVIEKIRKEQEYYSGSAELTTAFCLEALGKFLFFDTPAKSRKKAETDSEQRMIRKEIKNIINKRFSNFDSGIRDRSLVVRKKISRGDRKLLITLLPYFLDKALGKKRSTEKERLAQLGAASMYGWMAYTIYDDFFDGEGNSKFLSLGNICLRELVAIYHDNFSGDKIFLNFFKSIMDRIDAANTWETINCRAQIIKSTLIIPDQLPDFGKMERLADRSIGHALGSAAVLYLHTGNIESQEMKNLMAFFENYIIARQLNDDAHDWEKDLRKGQLSPTVVLVLEKYLKRDENKNMKEVDLKKEIKELQKIFWHEVIQEVCGKTLFHIKEAKKYLEAIVVMKNKSVFKGMLEAVEKSAQEAITEQKEMLDFLEEYE